jgi:hypothetical protein
VTRGERLLKTIYETIRNSPHWESSVLIITYDEHGGFYDHVAPPPTVAPGDATPDPANDLYHFDFRQLGVRVPRDNDRIFTLQRPKWYMSLANVHRPDPLLETGEVAGNVDSIHANSIYKDHLPVLIHT